MHEESTKEDSPLAGATLREFTAKDIPAALELWAKTEGIGLNESDTPEALKAFLSRNPSLSRVAEYDGRLIGALLCGHDGRRGYLHHLAVEKANRCQGIGRALVKACINSLQNEGILKCNLFLYTSNIEGRAFWLRSGWSVREDLRLVQIAMPSTMPPRRSKD